MPHCVDDCEPNIQADTHTSQKRTRLRLRGLNIQWPFSQLLLSGLKLVEARRYALGYHGIAHANEELWLIETPGPATSTKNAMPENSAVSPRPAKAQIVRTICFTAAIRYTGRRAFRADAGRHRIAAGGNKEWRGDGQMYAWEVGPVRALQEPIPIIEKG